MSWLDNGRSQILEGHIPPRYSVAEVMGYIKGNRQLRWRGSLVDDRGTLIVNNFGHGACSFNG
jgi:hypothetical protein